MEKEDKIFYSPMNEMMVEATLLAKKSFKYLWRELYWERRRIVPALDSVLVKVQFEQMFEGVDGPVVEHMWINEIDFDGEKISGILINSPHELTNVSNGDSIVVELDKITDWMFVTQGKTYGAFSVQALRSTMSETERVEHDGLWGLDFGDFNTVLVAYEEVKHPENLVEHPMSIAMSEAVKEHFANNPEVVFSKDENGMTLLHREAIAGNKTIVEILLDLGADSSIKNNYGKTALDYAVLLNWEHIIPILK